MTLKHPLSASPKKIKARVDDILTRLQALNPNPRCELYYETPFQLLVSVVLSAQATDKSVNDAMTSLYKNKFTPETIIHLGEAGFLEKIRKIGLAPTKAKNVVRLSKIILDKFDGHIPKTRDELESLPGVGRKTANVILGEIFQEPTLAVDTHVFRVTSRLGFHSESSPEKAETKLLQLISPSWLPKAHHWFILLGRYTCTARAPKCNVCPINDLCPSKLGLTK